MKIVLVTGSAGLIGSESVRFFCDRGFTVVGIDNNMRQVFFGKDASTEWNRDCLLQDYGDRYIHHNIDIRNHEAISQIFHTYGQDISLIIHTAAQPSHDWAANDPYTDFTVNANGTLVLLENTRQHCPEAVFIFCSTNKVYGDSPNLLPLVEKDLRWEIEQTHPYYQGINEKMSIDNCKHSLFGASKVAADVLVQEYGRYFNMKTACFRGGCLTGPSHSGTKLHGFLSYLMKCTITGQPYQVYGYKGKQVRDNIHSYDLVNAFYHFYQAPRVAEVYNIGGSRFSNCSMLEAIGHCEAITDKKLTWNYVESNRIGDHIWWISDVQKFKSQYPNWELTYTITDILQEIFNENIARWPSIKNLIFR
ncbi:MULTISPECIES: NAD-dependent epimerase/dehydratase family protein [unclassified Tolypothrix]|uniref:NAD-dependent epimerase/dehydratase family protein n=1 Tax=unclassified Tolypothrix TaxID=2649714 RepID=UPI0005F886BC|nr:MULTISPECIES: NAD-dependent epimerase/dehydratase family protein [unclassified Tolypothrix]MBE9081740.1 NAD-dependent epimerase/dehydratase family protein [Tolypothrix sp. LEGE 11397]UYD26041.1 NAD-dependent epimerase/dehydratase family protein [Tolypothrix sp. PCC 7712]UYD31719.1 NAD-dependent epimerase/dehydratase family protein [Tolypothrix sp. PCC 7601]BAY92055.1 NAD-dependent epimerase/dehydratase [Microchaete diplosiphon NIES-3275]